MEMGYAGIRCPEQDPPKGLVQGRSLSALQDLTRAGLAPRFTQSGTFGRELCWGEVALAVQRLKGRRPGVSPQRGDIFQALNKSFPIMEILQARIHITGHGVEIISPHFLAVCRVTTNLLGKTTKHTHNDIQRCTHRSCTQCPTSHSGMCQAGT